MRVETNPQALQQEALSRRARGEKIGFVPTMGFLHAGHTSLMELCRPRCDWLVASIYVNPLQFGPSEDLSRYPRDPEGDSRRCEAAGVDMLFMPPELYEADHSTTVHVSGLTEGLCGDARPGHFDGVTTVVARLFGFVQPSIAVFGEKDFQQLVTIRRMTRDLALPIEIVGGPLIRDHDGLALSSRNIYLSPDERRRALSLSRALGHIAARASEGEVRALTLLEEGRELLELDRLDYLELRDPLSLRPLDRLEGPARALVAGRVGLTRLLDNLVVLPMDARPC